MNKAYLIFGPHRKSWMLLKSYMSKYSNPLLGRAISWCKYLNSCQAKHYVEILFCMFIVLEGWIFKE